MSKKIYVGNLSYNTTEESLQELFQRFGAVSSVVVMKDKFTGMSKGFGFVEFEADEQADSAVHALNGKDFEGRRLRVNEAQDRRRPQRRDFPRSEEY